jgi:hypothetical protein
MDKTTSKNTTQPRQFKDKADIFKYWDDKRAAEARFSKFVPTLDVPTEEQLGRKFSLISICGPDSTTTVHEAAQNWADLVAAPIASIQWLKAIYDEQGEEVARQKFGKLNALQKSTIGRIFKH